MDDYVKNLEDAKEDIAGTATTPAEERLFKVINNPQLLYYYTKQYFHTIRAMPEL